MNRTVINLTILISLISQLSTSSDYNKDLNKFNSPLDLENKSKVLDLQAKAAILEANKTKNAIIKQGIQRLQYSNHILLTPSETSSNNERVNRIDFSHNWAVVAGALIAQDKHYNPHSDPECHFVKPSAQAQQLLTMFKDHRIYIAQPMLYDLYEIANKKQW